MTQTLCHSLNVRAVCDQQRSVCVPETVKVNVRKSTAGYQTAKVAGQCIRAHRCAEIIGEQQTIICPPVAHAQAAGILPSPIILQQRD